jgi:hypothetical protein
MVSKGTAILALLLLAALGTVTTREQASGQVSPTAQNGQKTSSNPANRLQAPAETQPNSNPGTNVNSGATPNCDEGPCDAQPSHITVANPPATAPAPTLWQLRVTWIASLAYILLAVLGYVGIMVALSTLKKIERQSRYAETAAQAAADSAQAALLHAQAIIRAERPWILITVEPSRSVDNSFTVTAANRGRGPAKIVSTIDKITTAVDQTHLPNEPDFSELTPSAALTSAVLLPGESSGIKTFSRDEVKSFCGSDEKLKRVEKWEELILLYGKVVYKDLMPVGEGEAHETVWCCWYIHGRQKSGMVMAGPPAYNLHT